MAASVKIGFTADDIWVAGSTRRFAITVTDGSGAAKDLTGASSAQWRMTDISAAEGTPTAILDKAIGTGVAITDPANGELTVTVAGSESESLAPGDYYYEARVVDSASDRESVTTGSIRLSPSLFAP